MPRGHTWLTRRHKWLPRQHDVESGVPYLICVNGYLMTACYVTADASDCEGVRGTRFATQDNHWCRGTRFDWYEVQAIMRSEVGNQSEHATCPKQLDMNNNNNQNQGPPPIGPIPYLDLQMMEELLQAPTEGVGDAIVVPLVLAIQFELKIGLLNLVIAISFHGFENDDP
ncbi:hypothetical protein Tco_0542867 [Tanacetum coccineum]